MGTKTGALSNRLTSVDRKLIVSTVPSTSPSTLIQSPGLKRFSAITRNPEIRFLNKSCAPKATATPNNPSPARIGPILMPQTSRMVAAPMKINKNRIALTNHSTIGLVKTVSSLLNKNAKGSMVFTKPQKMVNATRDRTKLSAKIAGSPLNCRYLMTINIPRTIGINRRGFSSAFRILSSNSVFVRRVSR